MATELKLKITQAERRERGGFFVLRDVIRQFKRVWFALPAGDVTIIVTRKEEKEG